MAKKGCLGCLGLIVVLVGGSTFYKFVIKKKEQARVDKIQEEQGYELDSFAREFVPEVYKAIQELDNEIARREASLEKLAEELAKVGRVASQDKDFVKWEKKIGDLRVVKSQMIDRRNEVFIAHQKYNYDPDSEESKKMIEDLMAPADREAENVLSDLEKLRKDS